jgi:hypothetical protein
MYRLLPSQVAIPNCSKINFSCSCSFISFDNALVSCLSTAYLFCAANAVGSNKTDAKVVGQASGSVIPVNVSREFDVANVLDIKCHESPRPLNGNSSCLLSDQPPATEENDVKSTLPGVNCGDNMQLKAEADSTQEEKCREINGKLIAEHTVAEQNRTEQAANSCHSNSHEVGTMDPFSCLSNDEVGKSENCPSSELSVVAALITSKTESNLTSDSPSIHCANQEHEKSGAAPDDTNTPLVIMVEKSDSHELKTVADGSIQSSMEAKSLEDTTNIIKGTSKDSYINKDTSKDHRASAVDSGVSVNRSVKQMGIIKDKVGSLLPDSKHPSCKDILEMLTESKSLTSDMVETDGVAMKVGMTVESCNEAGKSAPMLDISNAVCKVVVKPTQTCGEGQLCGEDAICSNRESDIASREPVNA